MSNLTVGLQDFIRTSGVVPPQFQLEFLERMGNLCLYSGLPMTPDFKLWLERKFGLQFVRAVQDFSTWDIPKLTSDTVRLLSLYFPNQYRGIECRLAFFRLFDVTCESPELCLYTGVMAFSAAPIPENLVITSPLDNGNIDLIQSLYPTFGANRISGGDENYYIQIISDGSDLEGWSYDDLGNQMDITWNQDNCPATAVCYESDVLDLSGSPDATIDTLFGYQYIGAGQVFFADPGSYEFINDYIQLTYGLEASASIVDLGGGQFQILINNIVTPTASPITGRLDLDGLGNFLNFNFNEIPC